MGSSKVRCQCWSMLMSTAYKESSSKQDFISFALVFADCQKNQVIDLPREQRAKH